MVPKYRPVDAQARALVHRLLAGARHAVLGTLDPDTGAPYLSRIALQIGADGVPVALLSGLALHSRALSADPRAALLIVADDTDANAPLAQPRLSVQVTALPLRQLAADEDAARRAEWRARDPKSAVYVGLPDFSFWRMEPTGGLLNAGFGQAFRLDAGDVLAGSGDAENPAAHQAPRDLF